jgi:hypothetical protein
MKKSGLQIFGDKYLLMEKNYEKVMKPPAIFVAPLRRCAKQK